MSLPAIMYGVRAHDFGRAPAGELAARIKEAGFDRVQLAPSKALTAPLIDDDNWRCIADDIGARFSAAGVGISVLGCYINPVDDDETRRVESLASFGRHLSMARLLGSPVVGTETGWSDSGNTRSPAAMKIFLRSLERLLELAEESGGGVAIEGVCRHVVWRPRIMGEVLRTMASPRLTVIYDPVNYIDETNWRDQTRLIEEAFDSFGDSIVAVHAKDFLLANGIRTCPAGDGLLDWPLVLQRLSGLRRSGARGHLPFLLEDTRPADLPRARRFIESRIWNLPDRNCGPGTHVPLDKNGPMAYHEPIQDQGDSMAEKETLVIASKVKAFIKDASELKCSAAVIDALSDKVRALCEVAIKNAKADGRKTVQEKDFK